MSEQEYFDYWQSVVAPRDEVQFTEPAHLGGALQAFRPTGAGVERMLRDFPGAPEILPRLLELYRVTAPGWDETRTLLDPFVVQAPLPATEGELLDLAQQQQRNNVRIVEAIAAAANREALARMRDFGRVVLVRGAEPEEEELSRPQELIDDYCITLTRLGKAIASPLHLLEDAFFTATYDQYVTYYLMWPLWAPRSPLREPFQPYFELWKRGAQPRYAEDGRLLVYVRQPGG